MATNSIIGYSAAGVGLAIIAFSSKISPLLSFLGTKSMIYTIMAGIVLVAGGVAFVLTDSGFSKSSKIKHAAEEVPIYEGEGKKRRIVGYKKVKE